MNSFGTLELKFHIRRSHLLFGVCSLGLATNTNVRLLGNSEGKFGGKLRSSLGCWQFLK